MTNQPAPIVPNAGPRSPQAPVTLLVRVDAAVQNQDIGQLPDPDRLRLPLVASSA